MTDNDLHNLTMRVNEKIVLYLAQGYDEGESIEMAMQDVADTLPGNQ